MQKKLRANNQIRVPEVSLIDEDGSQIGVVPVHEALRKALEKGLDLVEVGPTAQPPIAKIMDFGKYMYQLEKREKQSRGKQVEHETKTIRIGYKTGEHDMAFKAEKADEFLGLGHTLKLELTLRGREKALAHIGKEKLIKFMGRLTTPIVSQGNPMRGPYGWVVMVQRDKKIIQANGKKPQNKESAPEAN